MIPYHCDRPWSGNEHSPWIKRVTYSTNCGKVYTQMQTFATSFSIRTLIHKDATIHNGNNQEQVPRNSATCYKLLRYPMKSNAFGRRIVQSFAANCSEMQTAATILSGCKSPPFPTFTIDFGCKLDAYTFTQFVLYSTLKANPVKLLGWQKYLKIYFL